MDARVEKLIAAFENNGWKLVGSADVSNDWWFEDIIELISIWRPNTNLYITLLTDPNYTERKEVWAVNVSLEIPTDKHYKFIDQITLNDIKRTDLDAFVKRMSDE